MLFDPKWDVKTDPFSLSSLIAWLEQQPADQSYKYVCNGHCLLAQYFKACGYENVNVKSSGVYLSGKYVALPPYFNDIAIGIRTFNMKLTFGAALKRAKYVFNQK